MLTAIRTTTALALLMATGVARASPPDPSVWLRGVYDNYHRSEKQPGSAEETVAPHASRRFAAMLRRDVDCAVKSHEICALDWDFIVNGQA
jgi:hypothetical protein